MSTAPEAPLSPAQVGGGPSSAANFIDIKIHGISGLPASWLLESGAPPIYNEHPFRYELDVKIAGQTHTFRNGRLLQRIPLYAAFIENAALPPISDGDEASSVGGGGAAAAPLPHRASSDVPTAVSAGQSAAEQVRQAAEEATKEGKEPLHDPSIPHGVLWALGPEADPVESKDDAAAKKDAKGGAAKGGKAAPVPQPVTEAVKPVLPNTTAPPPCIVRIPLTLQQLAAVEEQVEKFVPLVMTFRRVLRPNCPADWEDSAEARYQAAVPVSLKPLTAPGSTTFTADVPLEPIVADAPKEDEKGKKKAAPKKVKGGMPAALSEEADPSEAHPYIANKTTATVTITCHSAITRLPQSRPRPNLQPSDMIPKRLRPPQRAVEATKLFSGEVQTLIRKIIADFRQHVAQTSAGAAAVSSPEESEELRASFLNFLHTSGQAHAYKQALIPAVQAIVREKFIRKPNPTKEELARVSNELYTYLLDHLHSTMTKEFGAAAGRTTAANFDASPVARWKRLATEAEAMQEFAVAAKYHQERIVQCRPGETPEELPDVWCEYAEFCLRTRDVLKAEQGYREALALDFAHLPSLVGYGALLLSRSRFKEAEVFLQAAVDASGNSLTWGCVALYYDLLLLSLPDSAEDEAQRTLCARESKYAITQAVRTSDEASCTPEAAYERLATHLIELHHEDLANLCLAKANPGPACDLLYAKLFAQTQQYDESIAILTGYIEANPSDCQARLLLGDTYAAAGRNAEAEAQYDAALRIDPACGSGPAYVRLGNMYVALGKYKDALGAFIMGANTWPCGLTWLGVGVAYYRMDDMARAEQAFNESNILNNLNPKTWAYLALVCLRQKREDEGDQAFNQAIKLGLADPFLVAEIGAEQLRMGRFKIAEACFRRSLGIFEDCNTRMYLARTLSAMKRFAEAREEFATVARTTTNETQRQKAEEQIAMIAAA